MCVVFAVADSTPAAFEGPAFGMAVALALEVACKDATELAYTPDITTQL